MQELFDLYWQTSATHLVAALLGMRYGSRVWKKIKKVA